MMRILRRAVIVFSAAACLVLAGGGAAGAVESFDSHTFTQAHSELIWPAAVQGEEQLSQTCDSLPNGTFDGSTWCSYLTMVTDWVAGLGAPNGRCLHVFWGIWQTEPSPSYVEC